MTCAHEPAIVTLGCHKIQSCAIIIWSNITQHWKEWWRWIMEQRPVSEWVSLTAFSGTADREVHIVQTKTILCAYIRYPISMLILASYGTAIVSNLQNTVCIITAPNCVLPISSEQNGSKLLLYHGMLNETPSSCLPIPVALFTNMD